MKMMNKELVGASTTVLILGVLARGQSWGYDIVRQINEEAGGKFTWQEGTVYPVLHKLEKQGLVRSRWQQAAGDRPRKYYMLTRTGHEALDAGRQQWELFHELVLRLAGVKHA